MEDQAKALAAEYGYTANPDDEIKFIRYFKAAEGELLVTLQFMLREKQLERLTAIDAALSTLNAKVTQTI